jgi:long-chain acyl-CoA synthetase
MEEEAMEKIWLKSYPPGVPAEVDVDVVSSVGELFDASVRAHGDRRAFISGATGTAITYRELDRLSRDFAAYLQSVLKLPKGARVALMMPNILQYPVAMFGTLRAGYTVVNVNPLYTPRELAHQLKDSGASAIVILENVAHVLEKAMAEAGVKHVIVTGVADMLGFAKRHVAHFLMRRVKKMVPPFSLPGHTGFRDALARGAAAPYAPVKVVNTDVAFLQYTGGTTGVSKGAILTHRNVVANLKQIRAWSEPFLELDKEMIGITAIPMYHIYALTNCALLGVDFGATNVLVADPRNMPGFVKILSQYRFAMLPAVNTLFNGLLADPGFAKLDFSSLKVAAGGGAAVQRSVAEKWQKVTGVPLKEGYGLTECSPTVTANRYDVDGFSGSIGLPLPSTEISVRDDDGNEVPPGEPGELCVRGPQVMAGYWNRPEETAKVMTPDGFLRTGDVAKVDDKGYAYIVDRKKDMILVSGFNVYPNEIEDVVGMHPGVFESAAVGVPDAKSGEAVMVFVVKKDPALTAEALIAHCRKHMTSYKIPRHVRFRAELPKSNVGKILRRDLRDVAVAETAKKS